MVSPPSSAKYKMQPTPQAMATAIKIASNARDMPLTKSPAKESLIAFVIRSPGTKSIRQPMITLSMCNPVIILLKAIEKIPINPPQIKFEKKGLNCFLLK